MNGQQSLKDLTKQSVWPLDRIKDHAFKIGSGITPTGGATSYVDSGIPLLRSQNIHFDGLRLDDVAYIDQNTHDGMSGTKLRPGDVLLNITGASIGRCTFVPEKFGEGNVNQHVCIIRPSGKLNHKYLNYCLAAPWGQDQILSSFTGASRQGLGQRDLGEIRVPLPPLEDQENIAAYLDGNCGSIDSAIGIKRGQLELLSAIRQALISTATTRGLSHTTFRRVSADWLREVPTHWDVCRVKRVLSRMDYGISVSTEPDGRYPVLKMGHLQDGEISFTDLDFVDEVSQDMLLETGDVLYNRTNSADQVGKAAVFRKSHTDAVTFASYLVRLRVNHRINPYFLTYVLNSDGFLGFARKLAIPSVQQSNLNSTRYGQLFIPLPPKDEQNAICRYLDEKLGALRRIAQDIQAQIDILIAYRKSLIHECVTGQRRIHDIKMKEVASLG